MNHIIYFSIVAILLLQGCSPFRPMGKANNSVMLSSFADPLIYKPQCIPTASLEKVQLQRLTVMEYQKTIEDLFQIQVAKFDFPLADEVGGSGFSNDTKRMNNTSLLLKSTIQGYFDVAFSTAAAIMATKSSLVLVCSQNTKTCRTDIIKALGKKLFRRSLTTGVGSETEKLELIMAAEATLADGAELILGTLLSSPDFVYKSFGSYAVPTNGVVKLNNSEIATRLAYMLWSSAPDEDLINANLSDPVEVSAQVDRMLASTKAERLGQNFGEEWFKYRGLKEIAIDEEFTIAPKLLDSAITETEKFMNYVFRESPRLLDLYDAKYSYINNDLASFYGVSGSFGDDLQMVSNVGEQRGGMLGQMAVLASRSAGDADTHPVARGLWIVNEVLCHEVDPPPKGVDTKRIIKEARTPKDAARLHASQALCISCHSIMDPLGFGLENYNAIGQWQTKYNNGDRWGGKGISVDATGVLGGQDFDKPSQMRTIVAGLEKTQNCLTKKVYTYALGRDLNRRDYCPSEKLAAEVVGQNLSFKQLIKQIVTSDVFIKGARND